MTDKYIRELIKIVNETIKLVQKTGKILTKSKMLETEGDNDDITEGHNDEIIESVFEIDQSLTSIKGILIDSKNNPQSIKNLGGQDKFWIWSLNLHIHRIESLIDIYDSHNIIVLPSFTEGQPYILDECLSRKRPIVIFEDIIHTIQNRKGIFVSKREAESFLKTIKHIMNNYEDIQKDIEKNRFYSKKEMIKEISDIFK